MRMLGLDVGERRIGMAVSDALGITAQPLPTHRCKGRTNDIACICQIAREQGAEKFVLGLPKNMNGTVGPQAEYVLEFGKILQEQSGLPVEYVDERLTSMAAHRALSEGNVHAKDRKGKVDQIAAVYILQNYMDRQKMQQLHQ